MQVGLLSLPGDEGWAISSMSHEVKASVPAEVTCSILLKAVQKQSEDEMVCCWTAGVRDGKQTLKIHEN